MDQSKAALIDEWDSDLRVICHSHYEAATRIARLNYLLGVPVVVLTTGVGTSVFAALEDGASKWAKPLLALASFGAAVLAALQTFLKLAERAEKHRQAGALFGSLLKEIEQLRAIPPSKEQEFKKWADSFRQRWDDISKESVTVPSRIWKRHKQRHKPSAG